MISEDLDLLCYDFDNDIDIIPIADVHLGSMQCQEERWKKFCEDVLARPNCYLILDGDLLDSGFKTSKTDVYSQVYSPMQQMEKMISYLKPISSRILCITEGNHEARLTKETTYSPSLIIATELGIRDKFRYNMAFLQIRFNADQNLTGKKRPSYSFCCLHGASKTRHNQLAYAVGTDVFITGHTHENLIMPKQKLEIDPRNKKVFLKDIFQISVSSWLNWGGYGMNKAYLPQATMLQTIHLSADRKHISVTLN